jgi:acyl carrier protein
MSNDTRTVETSLVELWSEALGQPAVEPEDDFFDLGGNSIMAIRLLPAIQERTGVEPSIGMVFDHPTPRALAAALVELGAR